MTDIDGLTGLAEYRNGGLFVDTGVLTLRDPDDAGAAASGGREALVVGWRALTVALLDRLAPMVRERLGVARRPSHWLACWRAAPGRRVGGSRRRKRPDGGPPHHRRQRRHSFLSEDSS